MYKILEGLATDGLVEPSELPGYVDCERPHRRTLE
jgi:hypothetical protein